MTAQLKVSDGMMETAQAIIKLAKTCGIDIKLSQIYNNETARDLALITAQMRMIIEKSTNSKIEVINA